MFSIRITHIYIYIIFLGTALTNFESLVEIKAKIAEHELFYNLIQ